MSQMTAVPKNGGKKQQDKKKGKPSSAGKSGPRIRRYWESGRLQAKKARHMIRRNAFTANQVGERFAGAVPSAELQKLKALADRQAMARGRRAASRLRREVAARAAV